MTASYATSPSPSTGLQPPKEKTKQGAHESQIIDSELAPLVWNLPGVIRPSAGSAIARSEASETRRRRHFRSDNSLHDPLISLIIFLPVGPGHSHGSNFFLRSSRGPACSGIRR